MSLIPSCVFDVPIDGQQYLKRKLFVTVEGKPTYIACFCKDANGVQYTATKKSKGMYHCHFDSVEFLTEGKPKCGFHISEQTIKYLQESKCLAHLGDINFPICSNCGASILRSTNSNNLYKMLVGNMNFTCECKSAKNGGTGGMIEPIDSRETRQDWNLGNYYAYRAQKFGHINPNAAADYEEYKKSTAAQAPVKPVDRIIYKE
jgi:hypothetical protein